MDTIQPIRDRLAGRGTAGAASLAARFRALARPLRGPGDLDPLLERIGDARATDMLRAGMVNVGQLVRERDWRDGVVLVGFGSYHGSVIAGDEWGAPMERMPVPPAQADSHEAVLHEALGGQNALFHLYGAATSDRCSRRLQAPPRCSSPGTQWRNRLPLPCQGRGAGGGKPSCSASTMGLVVGSSQTAWRQT